MSEHDSRKKDEKSVVEFRKPQPPAEEPGGASAAPAQADPQEGAPTADSYARLQAERDELLQTMIRRQADFENYRKRVERDRIDESRRGVGRLAEELLPILDGFARALRAHGDPSYEAHRKGLELIYRQLWDALSRNGVERIEAAGKPFNPHLHEAVDRVENQEVPDGTVLEVLQEGFTFHGRVLRPSSVRVSVNPQGTDGDNSSAVRNRAD
jgi:molecular chaperone GrpE